MNNNSNVLWAYTKQYIKLLSLWALVSNTLVYAILFAHKFMVIRKNQQPQLAIHEVTRHLSKHMGHDFGHWLSYHQSHQ